jgi:hypothetical protein
MLPTCAFSATLVTVWENEDSLARGVHWRQRPGARSREDGTHITVQGGDGWIWEEEQPVVLGSHPEFKELVVQGAGEQVWAAWQVSGKGSVVPSWRSEEAVRVRGCAGGQRGCGRWHGAACRHRELRVSCDAVGKE